MALSGPSWVGDWISAGGDPTRRAQWGAPSGPRGQSRAISRASLDRLGGNITMPMDNFPAWETTGTGVDDS
eukprot:3309794-Pyramimonas_sp.AAC.1